MLVETFRLMEEALKYKQRGICFLTSMLRFKILRSHSAVLIPASKLVQKLTFILRFVVRFMSFRLIRQYSSSSTTSPFPLIILWSHKTVGLPFQRFFCMYVSLRRQTGISINESAATLFTRAIHYISTLHPSTPTV